jgi:Exo-beta-D-glucosaminidase Ig-fold domain/Glycosyl hydrolase 2 galactose-binding domain-like/Glycosyl hydrolases family 2/F5/8 type C domain
MHRLLILAGVALFAVSAQEFTRGVGIYPGDPNEYSGPTLAPDQTYRNLAFRRPAYQSSSYDYNLTAQLLTDGVKDTVMPRWVATWTSELGEMKKNQREWLLDGNWVTSVPFRGHGGWVQFEFGGGDRPLEIDRIEVDAHVTGFHQPENWSCTLLGSDDGQAWTKLGMSFGMAKPGGDIETSIPLASPAAHRYYRVAVDDPRAMGWTIGEVSFFRAARQVHFGGPFNFTSAWMPAGKGEEWTYVDLGAPATFDRIELYWIRRAAEGALQVSDDAKTWRTFENLPAGGGDVDNLKLAQPVHGRYVRLLMTRPATPDGYVLSEFEIYGRGGLAPRAKTAAAVQPDGRLDLAGGDWRLERDSRVTGSIDAMSRPGFDDSSWLIATVPGTVIASYDNAGAIPDPNFGDNQLAISDSFFYADFWYRDEFVAPPADAGKHVWLNMNGINWKADVYLNGQHLGEIDGGFIRGRFDVTKFVQPGEKNVLLVRVIRNAHPGSVKQKTFETPDKNGGVLGADNPTYHATIGWDWIPTIRGRDNGIWGKVYLTTSGPVTVEHPFVQTTLPLPDTSRADVSVEATLVNHDAQPVNGRLVGRFGDITFETPVTIDANSERTVKLDPSTTPALRIEHPQLWWPNGYGEPHLYNVQLSFDTAGGQTSDTKAFKAGIREFTYDENGGTLHMWINGRHFIPRGGNWGFSESMLRYGAREYDVAVRYHKEMNFNMIRDWVGQIGQDAFYDACDRWGIVVWQDFWLANPWDGPDPDNDSMFMENARDLIERLRNHPSMGLYCGRNEGYPPKPIDDGLRHLIATLEPDLHYISSSADDVVSGHGPYQAMPSEFYFSARATTKIHSELGMPNIVTLDSLKLMMPESGLWPIGDMWGIHDFCVHGAAGAGGFIDRVKNSYGPADNVAEWVTLAQFVNYNGYRAMFEAQSRHRMGLLIWMSHPTWPSLVWQTYDYYFDPTAAYFGARKASEPLHIQWNPVTNAIEVVNYSVPNATGLTAEAEIVNMDGTVKWKRTATLDSAEDSMTPVIHLEFPPDLSPTHFIRLRLTQGDKLISRNFYWRGTKEGDYTALRTLPKVAVEASSSAVRHGDEWSITTRLHNPSQYPVLMIHLKVVRDKTGDRILPAIYSDNYVSLMPGESRTITTSIEEQDTRGESPRMVVEGFNVTEAPRTP